VVREGVGAGGEMTQALYAHMNNKIIIKKKDRCTRKPSLVSALPPFQSKVTLVMDLALLRSLLLFSFFK
jgi:hypothetical protein